MTTDDVLKLIGMPAAVVGAVVVTWESLTATPLILRLIATLVLAIMAHEFAMRSSLMTQLLDVRNRGASDSESSVGLWRKIKLGMVVCTLSLIFVLLAWMQTSSLVISAEIEGAAGKQSLRIDASSVEAEYLLVELPSAPVECDVREEGARLTEIDWEQPDRLLRIDRFVAPQVVVVTCATDAPFKQNDVTVHGDADGPYFRSELGIIQTLIVAIGVLLWSVSWYRFQRRFPLA